MELFKTTAVAALVSLSATTAFAESHAAAADDMMEMKSPFAMADGEGPMHIRSRDITGGAVYTTAADNSAWNDVGIFNSGDNGVIEIGEIEDVVLDRNGKMIGVVAEVGGFLDIGDKHVMLPIENVRLRAMDDQSYAVITTKSEEELEEMDSVDEGFWN